MDRVTRIHRSGRTSRVDLDADSAWRVVAGAGAGAHWYADALPFIFRGALDRVVGGEGLRWPVPDRAQLEVGDTAGFWRVTRLSAPKRTMRLEADVVAPGRVFLDASVHAGDDGSEVTTTVGFEPDGLVGQLYMYVDLAARETVAELVHRRLLADLGAS